MDKIKILKITLRLGAAYYLMGAVAHFWGLTIFPFYDGRLYEPYLDSIIALVAFVLALLLLVVARDPIKNIDTLNVIIFGAFLASIFSIAIIWKVNFLELGAPAKETQTIVEGILGFIFTGVLLLTYPRKSDKNPN